MIVTRDNHEPCRVYDGTGREWTDITEVNTETGLLERLVTDKYGRFKINDSFTEIQRERHIVPLPIKFEPVVAYGA